MSEPNYKLVQLVNGTFSIHSLAEKETFHPVVGPVAEAQGLYVDQLKLVERMRVSAEEFVIWDVGLGAAANVLTALRATRELECPVRVISFDRTIEPLEFALRHEQELGYLTGYEEAVKDFLRDGKVSFLNGRQKVEWVLHLGEFPRFVGAPTKEVSLPLNEPRLAGTLAPPASSYPAPHAILFDAYSPATNPDMWTEPLFSGLFRMLDLRRPCALPTYSRSTMLRVTLLLAGFFVGVGHPTGEKDETTLAANTLELLDEPLPVEWLERVRKSRSAEPMWEPVYRQAPLSAESWAKLLAHPQFKV